MSKVEEKKNREKVYCGTHFGSSSLLVSQVANDHHLGPCKVIQDVLGILDSIFTRWMPHFIYWIPCQWHLNSGFQSLGKRDSGFLELNNEFHSQGFRIPPAKISRIPESRHALYGATYQRAHCGLIWFIGNWPEPLLTFSLLTRVMFVKILIFVISVSTLN